MAGTVKMRVVDGSMWEPTRHPGDVKWAQREGRSVALLIICPGCTAPTFLCFEASHADHHPVWAWDGDVERPTLLPAIHHRADHGGCGWHGHLTRGFFVPCS